MTADLHTRLERIAAAPAGPGVAAYLDFDGTLIAGYSAAVFYRRRLLNREIGAPELLRTLALGLRGIETAEDFDRLMALSLSSLVGVPTGDLAAHGREVFVSELGGLLHREMWEIVAAHHARGHRVVIATSATRFQVADMAQALGIDDVLCTEVEQDAEGRLTGRTSGPSMFGAGKATAVAKDMADAGVDPQESFAYSNGWEDVALLEEVGHPMAVQPDDRLRDLARERDWPILTCRARQGPVLSATEVVRTAGFYTGMLGSVAAAVGVGLLNRDHRQAVDLSISLGGEVSLGLAGIAVDVEGAAHLVEHRPCVFVFNHQSAVDVPIMMKLLRSGFTGVVKAEAASIPVWGSFFRFADAAFVERTDTGKAREALEPAVRRLREDGVSLVLSPEGTRTPTPTLGPFKKGAFHIAMQAGVPMVPVVIRNASDVMARGRHTLRSGTVQVKVLPAVDTSAWTPETIDEHVADVRGRFVETLATWGAV